MSEKPTQDYSTQTSVIYRIREGRERFPWNIVRGWTVSSLSDGSILIEPDYIPKPVEEGCAPVGVLTRIRLALWISDRLMKRRTTTAKKLPSKAP